MAFGGRLTKAMVVAWSLGAGLLADTACAAEPTPSLTPTLAPTPAEATVTVKALPLKVGTDGMVDVVFDVIEGYHWNAEYPATLEVREATGAAASAVRVAKRSFAQLKPGEFESTERQAAVHIPLKLAAAGEAALPIEVHFSVCNNRMCLRKTQTVTAALRAN